MLYEVITKNIFSYLNTTFRLGLPYKTVAILFLYLLGFYVFLLSLKVDKWMSLVGAIAFAFGSYNLIIIIAGHITVITSYSIHYTKLYESLVSCPHRTSRAAHQIQG